MGKKNKKDKKGQGKEKTLQKTQKNASKRVKKELAVKGEDDVEKIIAEFQEKDKKKTQVQEDKCPPPSPRCNISLTAHPDKDELIMFGGEYFTGSKMYMYNDLFFYNIKKNEWLKVTAPNCPPPHSSHQAIALKQGGGQLWIFGGEFASPTQSQFYHYKDLWLFHLKEKKWENICAPGGPSARSGHRMAHCKKQLIVFGGFHDNIRDYKYFNDVFAFNLDTYTWVQIIASGIPPPPRSGFVMAAQQDQSRIVIYGGYSKERVKKDVDLGKMHTDMFALVPEGKLKDDSQPVKWKWVSMKQSGSRPSPRSGMSMTVISNNKAVCFGGVFDEVENEEQLEGKFYNSMYMLELDKGQWFEVELRGQKSGEKKKRRRRKDCLEGKQVADDEDDNEDDGSSDDIDNVVEEMETTETSIKNLNLDTDLPGYNNEIGEEIPVSAERSNDDVMQAMDTEQESVFKVTIGPQNTGSAEDIVQTVSGQLLNMFSPSPRINTLLAVKNGVLFLYGGIYEDGDKQFTLSDMYCLDTNKLDGWRTIIESDLQAQVWEESSSSSEEMDDPMDKQTGACGGEDDTDSDEDDDMDIDFTDAPERPKSEPIKDYYERTKDYWLSKAREFCVSEEITLPEKKLEKMSKEMCQEAFGS